MGKQTRIGVKNRMVNHHVICSNCRSKNTHIHKTNGIAFGIGCILASGVCLWVPIIGWIAAPLLFIFGLIAMIVRYAYSLECNDCGHIESLRKEEFEFLRDNGID